MAPGLLVPFLLAAPLQAQNTGYEPDPILDIDPDGPILDIDPNTPTPGTLSTPERAESPIASPWVNTFDPEALATYFEGAGLRILVTSAGAGPQDRQDATQSLIHALRQSGAAELVMDGAALGDMTQAGDQDIVKAAQVLPVERVVVLRVFPTGPELPPMAVVTVYSKGGSVLTAFTTQQGNPLGKRQDGGVAMGVGTESFKEDVKGDEGDEDLLEPAFNDIEVMDKSGRPIRVEADAKGKQAKAVYNQHYLYVEELVGADGVGGISGQGIGVYAGQYKVPLKKREIINALDDRDITLRYEQRRQIKQIIVIGTTLVGLAGIPIMARSSEFELSDPRQNFYLFTGGGLLIAGPTIAALFAASYNPYPLDAPETREAVEMYNNKLKSALGLAQAPFTLRPRVALGPGQGRLGLEVRF